MKLLVAFGSRTGFTKGIAEYIGEKLRARGLEADVSPAESVGNLQEYDGFIIGSAVYMNHWTKEVKGFVMRNRALLGTRPVWLFSSGPVGTQLTDAQGRDVRDVSLPKEIDELREAARPRGHHVFFGGLDGTKLKGATGFMYRMAMKSKSVRDSMPEGDFRDWKEIESWANGIADALALVPA